MKADIYFEKTETRKPKIFVDGVKVDKITFKLYSSKFVVFGSDEIIYHYPDGKTEKLLGEIIETKEGYI